MKVSSVTLNCHNKLLSAGRIDLELGVVVKSGTRIRLEEALAAVLIFFLQMERANPN